MNYTQIIELVISLGEVVLSDLKIKGAPPEVLQDVQAAIDGWLAVKDSPVTFAQLEALRTKPTF